MSLLDSTPLFDLDERVYVELPEHLGTEWVRKQQLPPRLPVLIWAGDCRSTDPLAVWLLAAQLGARHLGYLHLDLEVLEPLVQQTALWSAVHEAADQATAR